LFILFSSVSQKCIRKSSLAAIAGSDSAGNRELWLGKCSTNVRADEGSFEVRWLNRQGDCWELAEDTDVVFRTTVLAVVCGHKWKKNRRECVLPQEVEEHLIEKLANHVTSATRTIANLFIPSTPHMPENTGNSGILPLLLEAAPIADAVSACVTYFFLVVPAANDCFS
jgi:hypothetical protein